MLEEIKKIVVNLPKRPNWDTYGMSLALVARSRTTCIQPTQVGVVILSKEHKVVSTGYNGSPSGWDNCCDVGCAKIDKNGQPTGRLCRAVHAETNALLASASTGHNLKGATLYTTLLPCWDCFKNIVQSGIDRIVYLDVYKRYVSGSRTDNNEAHEVFDAAKKYSIELVEYHEKPSVA